MPGAERLPNPVKIIAWLLIAWGAICVLDMIVGLGQKRLTINSGVLGLLFGRGLLQGHEGWRKGAFWLSLISVPLGVALGVGMIVMKAPVKVVFFGLNVGYTSAWVGGGLCFLFAAAAAWAAQVLSSKRTKAAFVAGGAG